MSRSITPGGMKGSHFAPESVERGRACDRHRDYEGAPQFAHKRNAAEHLASAPALAQQKFQSAYERNVAEHKPQEESKANMVSVRVRAERGRAHVLGCGVAERCFSPRASGTRQSTLPV